LLPNGSALAKETKVRPLADLKVLDGGAGGFTGYGSVFGELDSEGDIVAKGAYAQTLAQFVERGFIAWGHAWDNPVATVKAAHEDGRGLFLEAEFHSDAQSQIARTRTAERLARGKFMGLSIGYLPLEFDRTEKGRVLTRIELFETSLVTVPALASAGVLAAKTAPQAGAIPAAQVFDVDAAFAEVDAKAGRRLSAASEARIRAAMDTLRELLGEPGDAEADALAADGLEAAGERLGAVLDGYAERVAAAPLAEVAGLGGAGGLLRRLAVARARLDTALARAADPDGLAPHALRERFAALAERFTELDSAAPGTAGA